MIYKLGSLFDGSGGFPLAGSLCGIEPRWASEVEPYPIAVTRERFPNMKHLGDISKINGAEIEPVDIITFGSPCQDLSVAGKRAGLKHEANGDEETTRSGLFMEAVRIIKEMRSATNGRYPRFALWENVPGAFSSNKGEDFRIVLEELIKVIEPTAAMPPVPRFGWPYADSYVGDGWSIAYRVFDAQYWGVPQRRRRIHLVADFRGECARKVLFERDGVRGYFAQGGEAGQGVAADAEGCAFADDREGQIISFHLTQDPIPNVKLFPCMGQGNSDKGQASIGVAYGIDRHAVCYAISSKQQSLVTSEDLGNTLGANDFKEPQAVCYRQGGFADYVENEVGTLKASGGDLGGGSENLIAERHAAAYGVDCRNGTEYEELNGTLQAKSGGGTSLNYNQVVRYRYIVRRLTPTECARLQGFADWWGRIEPKKELTDEEFRFWLEVRNTHAAINDKPTKDYTKKRMLTWYNKLYTDSAEYKMWGNGIALPPALYVLQGMADVLNAADGEVTDISDAPNEIKEEIIMNAEKLEQREAEETTATETTAERESATATVHSFDAAAQLKRLADERRALANIHPDSKRLKDDIRAIEYAVSVLEAIAI